MVDLMIIPFHLKLDKFYCIFFFFLHTLFQFGLIIGPIQNTGLINAKMGYKLVESDLL